MSSPFERNRFLEALWYVLGATLFVVLLWAIFSSGRPPETPGGSVPAADSN